MSEGTYENILFETQGNVAIITINRPKVMNAVDYATVYELRLAIAKCAADDDIRAVVITGTGRAFCSGDDLSSMGKGAFTTEDGLRAHHHLLVKAIRALRKPVIAAVNGYAHGAGSDIALACDFRIAAEEAMMGDIRSRRAITIGSGATYFMPRLIGLSKAIEILFTGDTFNGKEAERIGLANKAVPGAELMSATMELANKLAAGPTKAIGIVKTEIYRELHMSLDEALEDEMVLLATPMEDAKEGRTAFFEKRPPRFTGR